MIHESSETLLKKEYELSFYTKKLADLKPITKQSFPLNKNSSKQESLQNHFNSEKETCLKIDKLIKKLSDLSLLIKNSSKIALLTDIIDKNKKERQTAIHADTARKFFKDTNQYDIRKWHREDLQSWFRIQRAYHHQGIFILDQSHLVVPDNENYIEAVKMPVDEHGQLYPNLKSLTQEQKNALVYHRCYALSTLLNVSKAAI